MTITSLNFFPLAYSINDLRLIDNPLVSFAAARNSSRFFNHRLVPETAGTACVLSFGGV